MCNIKKLGDRACMGTRLGTRQVATLLEIFFTFDLVWVPGFGVAPQTTFDLFFSCFSKCETMEQYTCMILNNFVRVALQ